jgi:flagellar hook-length control protein FliK
MMPAAVTAMPADPVAMPAADAPAQSPVPSGEFLTVLLQLARLDGTTALVSADPMLATSPDAVADEATVTSEPRTITTLDPHAGASLLAALDGDGGAAGGDVPDDQGSAATADNSPTTPTALALAAMAVTNGAAAVLADAQAAGPSSPSPAPVAQRSDVHPSPAPDATKATAAAGDTSAKSAGAGPDREAAGVTTRDSVEGSGAVRPETAAAFKATAADAARLLHDRATVLRAAGAVDEARPSGTEPRSSGTTPIDTAAHVVPELGTGTARADGAARTEAPATTPRTVVEQVAERVVLLRREGHGEIALRLDPPDLGAVRIEAVMEGGKLRLEIRAEAEPARQALESSLPRLRESLAQQGIVADQVSVHLGLDSAPRDFTGGQSAPTTRPPSSPTAPPRLVAPVAHPATVRADGVDVWV